MKNGVVPSAETVRMRIILVLIAYFLPVIILTIAAALSEDRRPIILLLSFLAVGAILSLFRWLRRQTTKGRSKPKLLPPSVRQTLLESHPELADLTMIWRGGGDPISIEGRVLSIRFDLLEELLQGKPLPVTMAFLVGHEARHWAVRATSLLVSFRFISSTYAAGAGAVFASLLLNVAATFDDPDRLSLITATAIIPYIVAILQAALRRADGALVWWLEVDADRASLVRLAGPDAASTIQQLISGHAVGLQAQHVPRRLRLAALRESSTYRVIAATLFLSWFAVALPFGMAIVFALVTTQSPDQMNAMLAAIYIAAALSAVFAVALASWPVKSSRTSLIGATSVIWLEVQAATMRWFGRGLLFGILLISVKMLSDIASSSDRTFAIMMSGVVILTVAVAVVYLKASEAADKGLGRLEDRTQTPSWRTAEVWWLCAAAVCDAVRLSIIVWLLRATAVLPFFDDVGALGDAMRTHGEFVAVEMERIWTEEFSWLLYIAVMCLVWTSLLAAITISLRSVRLGQPDLPI